MTEPAQPGGLRVATMNLWGTYGAWPQRRRALITGFRKLRPDLVVFQEAVETPAQHQAAEVLGDGYHFAHHSLREPDGRGISAASRLAGDFDAGPAAASIRFWSGREALEGVSVCYRDAWESARPGEPGDTYTPDNPLLADWDWPFRRIDYIFIRCGGHGGPTLAVRDCRRIFDQPVDGAWASDHFGVCADLVTPPPLPPASGRPGKSVPLRQPVT